MLEFPKWFDNVMHMLDCPHCHKDLKKPHIMAEGIRKSLASKGETAFFIEYKCPDCNSVTTMELTPMTLSDFVMEMLDKFTDDDYKEEDSENKKATKKKKTRRSKITVKEIAEAKKIFNGCETWDEMMEAVGITEEQKQEWYDEYEKQEKDNK
jgi:hypothetical protein